MKSQLKQIKKIKSIKPGSKQDIALSNATIPGANSNKKLLKSITNPKIKQNLSGVIDAVKLKNYY